ncbi:MAG: bifunctional oligoribonuclease/PAP phosphatase NrnA [bacterium]
MENFVKHDLVTGNFYDKKTVEQAWELIKTSDKITLLTHSQPDGDGVSACAALDYILSRMGKHVETVYPNKPEFDFKRCPKNTLINKHIQNPDLIIACDTANYERLYFPNSFKSIPLVNIDHHISNSLNGSFNFVNGQSSSACEELYLLLSNWDSSVIDKYVAECLLFGIIYDSQLFHIQSTSSRTLEISAKLMACGANLFQLKTELMSNKSYKVLLLWGKILSNIKVSSSKNAVWAIVTQQDLKNVGVDISSLIGFNNLMSQICDVDVTLFFYETEQGQTKVSLRSKVTDVNEFAKQFGGGGHTNSAGILCNKPITQVVEEITSKL